MSSPPPSPVSPLYDTAQAARIVGLPDERLSQSVRAGLLAPQRTRRGHLRFDFVDLILPGRMIEIGGPTRLTYADMVLEYARERGLKRRLIRTPFYAPRLSAYWVHMVTPIHWRVVLPLIEGLRARLIVRDGTARKLFPQIKPIDFSTAVHLALGRILRDNVETSWSDALVTVAGDVRPYQFAIEDGMYVETRQQLLDLSPHDVFRSYTSIGGERGWLYMDWSWALRGWLDKAVGGVALRRGRRHPDDIRAGESLDFWRVEEVQTRIA